MKQLKKFICIMHIIIEFNWKCIHDKKDYATSECLCYSFRLCVVVFFFDFIQTRMVIMVECWWLQECHACVFDGYLLHRKKERYIWENLCGLFWFSVKHREFNLLSQWLKQHGMRQNSFVSLISGEYFNMLRDQNWKAFALYRLSDIIDPSHYHIIFFGHFGTFRFDNN